MSAAFQVNAFQVNAFQINDAVTLTSITITASSTPVAGGSVQFTATGNYSDSSHADITTQVTWASNNTNVARIDHKTGIADFMFSAGSCQITATL